MTSQILGGSAVASDNMPSPFVLDPTPLTELAVLPGDTISLDITLIGPGVDDAAVVVQAFQQAGATGLGKGRGRANLTQAGTVWTTDPEGRPEIPQPPALPRRAMVVLQSPWRSGAEPFTQRNFRIAAFLRAVWRRHEAVCAAFTGMSPQPTPHLDADVAAVQLWPVHQHRWSAKLRIEDDMSGTMGSFILQLPQNKAFWTALWRCQWLHIGQKTSFGLGALRVHPLAD